MKKIAMAVVFLGTLGLVLPAQQARAEVSISVSVSLGEFYDELSPHGDWIDCSYGECWVPRGVPAGWQPYTNGEWIYTRYGWTWVSNDPWGSDPYHYGTWTFVHHHGWVWVPGTVWAPAWVTWSYSDRYVGWAPMPPTLTFGTSGYSGRAVVVSESQYVFVPTNRFVGTNVTSVRMEPRRNAELFHQAKAVTRFGVSGGVVTNVAVPLETVQRAMGGRVETHEISVARTAPRTYSSGGAGKSGHVAIVAPSKDVKAAHASWQKAPSQQGQGQQQQHQQQAKQQEQAQQHQQQAKQQEQAQQHQQQAKQQEQAQQQQQKAQQQEQAKPKPPQGQDVQPKQKPENAKPPGEKKEKDEKKEG